MVVWMVAKLVDVWAAMTVDVRVDAKAVMRVE